MKVPGGLVLLIASLCATASVILAAYAIGPIRAGADLFGTPIPYALLFACFFIASPAYLFLRPFLRLRPLRFLLAGLSVGMVLFVWRGDQWNWHPVFLQPRNFIWLFGLPMVGALAYWATLRALAPEFDD